MKEKNEIRGEIQLKRGQKGIRYGEVHRVSGGKVRMEKKDLLHFISYKRSNLATCCSSGKRKLLFQMNAFCLVLLLAHTPRLAEEAID